MGAQRLHALSRGELNDQGLGRQFNADIAGSLNVRRFQLRGGAETSRGGLLGGESHAWVGTELPLNRDLAFLVGVDYANWDGQTSWGKLSRTTFSQVRGGAR